MADNSAKLEVTIGTITFKGEGDQSWLSGELQKVIEAAASKAIPHHHEPKPAVTGTADGTFTTSLASFLKEKTATSHNKRFLATALWLRKRGMATLSTAEVTKALRDNHQARLANPSQSLNNNTTSGYCEKNGKTFFITQEGLTYLGEAE